MPRSLDITGSRFCRLTALRRVGTAKPGGALWLFICACGNKVERPLNWVTCGNTRSCGCLAREHSARQGKRNRRHGHESGGRQSPEYRAYNAAKNRCCNSNNSEFHKYGNAGVKFLFTTFEQFYSELGPRPSPRHSVDRKNGGHYEPGNVRWADKCQQAWNRRKPRIRSSSKYKGPSWHELSQRWRVYISCRQRKIYVGSYRNEIDAAIAHDKAVSLHHGEFARLNFPSEATA